MSTVAKLAAVKIIVREVTVRGEKMFCADIPGAIFGKRIRRFAATAEAARLKAEGEIEERREHGGLASIGGEERALLRRYKQQHGLTVQQISDALKDAAEKAQSGVTVKDATARYLSAPRERELSDEHLAPLKTRLKRVDEAFGARPLASITPGELQDFVRSQGPSAPNYFSALRALFRFADRHEWVPRNPMTKVTRPESADVEKPIYTPEEMAALLRAAVKLQLGNVLRELVLGGFCGLRNCETMRLDASRLDLVAPEAHVVKMKTRHRGIRERYVTLEPMAVEWLKLCDLPVRGRVITVTERNLRIQRAKVLREAKQKWLDNGLRRSFASYYLGAFENADAAAERLGHTDAETTKAKYRVPRKKAVALAWWQLTPNAVLRDPASVADAPAQAPAPVL